MNSDWTNTCKIYTSLTCNMFVCCCIHSDSVVCRCYCTLSTASIGFWITGVTLWHTYLLSSPLWVQHVHNLLNHVELIQLHRPALSVFKNIFQLSMKRCWCFYNLCLGLLRENMGDERSSALPATYFLSLVSTRPTHILLPLFFIYNCISIFLFVCLIHSMPSLYLYFLEECISFCKF